ncbi:MAG: hypothetical protein WB711_16320 [Terriglobales bacterium]
MKTISLFALALTLGMGTASLLNTENRTSNPTTAATMDAAFRDGMYLGKLAAESGAERHIARGRWATVEDRALFSAGYQQAYADSLARRTPATREAE